MGDAPTWVPRILVTCRANPSPTRSLHYEDARGRHERHRDPDRKTVARREPATAREAKKPRAEEDPRPNEHEARHDGGGSAPRGASKMSAELLAHIDFEHAIIDRALPYFVRVGHRIAFDTRGIAKLREQLRSVSDASALVDIACSLYAFGDFLQAHDELAHLAPIFNGLADEATPRIQRAISVVSGAQRARHPTRGRYSSRCTRPDLPSIRKVRRPRAGYRNRRSSTLARS